MNIPLQVTPESMAAWCEQPEFTWLLGLILQESYEARAGLENIPADQVATIAKMQGVIAFANRLLQDNFRDVLVTSTEVEAKKDGGQSFLFALKIHQYRQGNQDQ